MFFAQRIASQEKEDVDEEDLLLREFDRFMKLYLEDKTGTANAVAAELVKVKAESEAGDPAVSYRQGLYKALTTDDPAKQWYPRPYALDKRGSEAAPAFKALLCEVLELEQDVQVSRQEMSLSLRVRLWAGFPKSSLGMLPGNRRDAFDWPARYRLPQRPHYIDRAGRVAPQGPEGSEQ